jgi:N6-adenosine-specific RNA methylase IME4/ParB-like chromosome segregation protein Spo0J
LTSHPAAELFPLLPAPELADLAADIKAHGLRDPIVTLDGAILDGRNRFAACELAGVEPRFTEGPPEAAASPAAYVLSTNLHRRHLTDARRALVAAAARDLFAVEARERMEAGTLPPIGGRVWTAERAAEALHVSPRAVERASAVRATGAPELAEAVGSGRVSLSAGAAIASAAPETQRAILGLPEGQILAAAREINARKTEVRRAAKFARLAEISRGNAPLAADRRYPVLLADPPWRYEQNPDDSRAMENHYPTMALADICALPVAEVATPDALLYLWSTSPKLAEAMRVVESWGFTYRSSLVWIKDKIGMGYWARGRHELLLVCIRGDFPTPPPEARPDSVIEAPRRAHSEKPPRAYEIIERAYPTLPKLELFARAARPGWAAWGNQAPRPEGAP